jgi:hypothetical protein
MSKRLIFLLVGLCILFSLPAFAVDGVTLINQATVAATGGFPYKITQPGSYKLSGNLVVPANLDGIDINVSNVTIDLNGFTISGTVTCSAIGIISISCTNVTTVKGIFAAADNIIVRNGSLVGFGWGMQLSGKNNLVEEIIASGNGYTGLNVSFGVVRRNIASQNGYNGITAFSSTVTDNIAALNTYYGLEMFRGTYGSNTLDDDGTAPVYNSGAVSQNNNGCDGTAC